MLQYGLAEDTMRSGKPDVSPNELYSQSAIYVAAAHALKPNYSVSIKLSNLLDFYFLLSYALMFSCFFPRNSMADSVPFCLMQVYRSALRLVRSMVQFIYSISKKLC